MVKSLAGAVTSLISICVVCSLSGIPEIIFSNTQEDLVRIIEMYKKGTPFSHIEKLFDDWKKNQENAKSEEDVSVCFSFIF